MDHEQRVAVVTGAGNGLGRAYALRLAADGARVAVADVDGDAAAATARLIEDAGGTALAVAADVRSEEDVQALAARVRDTLGACAILVNNAGISPNVAFDDLTFADWRGVMAVNVDGMFLTAKALVPQMREHGSGRIVNITSNTYGLVIGGFAHYTASKGAVIGFTRALATDLGGDGITVNAVAPGLTRTEATEAQWEGTTLFADMAERQALRRPGVPTDLAGVISFLASEDSGWITGQTLVVDGGLVRH